MKDHKIMLVTSRSDFGGGPRHVDQLVELLSRDYDLYMAYPQGGEPYGRKWDGCEGIKGRVYIPYRKFSLKALLELRRFVLENGIQIVHSHGNGAGLYSRLLKLLLPSVKVVHTYHGISDSYNSRIKCLLNKWMGRGLAPLADVYVAVSEGEKRLALQWNFSKEKNTVVIYNGISDSKDRVSPKLSSPMKIVTLSRFDYPKNMDSMYRIAKKLGNEAVSFVWVGDGPDFARLKQQSLADGLKIEFVGFSKEPFKYLLDSDIYLSTSRFEGLPYGLIEAASVGLPIVATNVKGNNECVLSGKTGFLFKTEDEACEIIKRILDSEALYSEMSENAVSFFHDNFTERMMATKLMEVYEKLLKSVLK